MLTKIIGHEIFVNISKSNLQYERECTLTKYGLTIHLGPLWCEVSPIIDHEKSKPHT